MTVLNAIYDNGKVTFKTKKLPKIKTAIKIEIDDSPEDELLSLPARGMWKDREEMADPVKWVNEQREKEETKKHK